jgi:hypothetical protein
MDRKPLSTDDMQGDLLPSAVAALEPAVEWYAVCKAAMRARGSRGQKLARSCERIRGRLLEILACALLADDELDRLLGSADR